MSKVVGLSLVLGLSGHALAQDDTPTSVYVGDTAEAGQAVRLYTTNYNYDGVDRENCTLEMCRSTDEECTWTWTLTDNGSSQEKETCEISEVLAWEASENIDLTMVQDPLGQAMLAMELTLKRRLMGRSSSGGSCEVTEGMTEDEAAACLAMGAIRRFKNLKAMTMTLQPVNVTVFGRYCYYGCWCLPNGQHNLAAGYGLPVDLIDEVCKDFALCYKCLDFDFGGFCNPEARSYRWGRILDSGGKPIDIKCKDNHEIGPTHRCKRYTCECDRVLAVGLSHFHWVWNESYHARWGGFDREANCFAGCDYNCPPQDDCCGAYGAASTDVADPVPRRPYASTSNTACCQDVYFYDVTAKECCLDTGVVSVVGVGDCDGTVLDPDDIDDFNQDFPGYTKK